MKDKFLRFDVRPELCIQCHACETACRTWRNVEPPISYRKVIAVEKGAYPDVKISYVTTACRHCENPACMETCPAGAIIKAADGTVLVDELACIGCGACMDACAYHIPQIDDKGVMRKCDLCYGVDQQLQRYPCARMCPTGALKLKL